MAPESLLKKIKDSITASLNRRNGHLDAADKIDEELIKTGAEMVRLGNILQNSPTRPRQRQRLSSRRGHCPAQRSRVGSSSGRGHFNNAGCGPSRSNNNNWWQPPRHPPSTANNQSEAQQGSRRNEPPPASRHQVPREEPPAQHWPDDEDFELALAGLCYPEEMQ